jgi:hypothetical protein
MILIYAFIYCMFLWLSRQYYVTMKVGEQAMPYFFDVDTGGSVTWLECDAGHDTCKTCNKVIASVLFGVEPVARTYVLATHCFISICSQNFFQEMLYCVVDTLLFY